jgi:hypothetical protein
LKKLIILLKELGTYLVFLIANRKVKNSASKIENFEVGISQQFLHFARRDYPKKIKFI